VFNELGFQGMHVFKDVPKFSFFHKPTLLEKLEKLSGELGVEVYVKRDDAIEFAMGGNKVKKLEFIVGEALANELERKGAKPYVIPLGRAIPTGVLGYVEASFEIAKQVEELGIKPKYIVHASGFGGTQAGLVLGSKLAKLEAKIIGIDIIGKPELPQKILELTREASEKYGFKANVESKDIIVYDYSFGGYGVLSEKITKIIVDVARTEGLLLDPVYTAKAFAGLLDLIGKGVIEQGSQVIFIHTGGYPIIFQHGEEMFKLMKGES